MGFLGLGGDKWLSTRDGLVKATLQAKEWLPDEVQSATMLLLGTSPAEIASYEGYLSHLNNWRFEQELPKLSEQARDGCALRLLALSTRKLGLEEGAWSVVSDVHTLKALVFLALPLLDRINDLLLERQDWDTITTYRVGQLLSTMAHSCMTRSETPAPAQPRGGTKAAMVRGMYSHGMGMVRRGEMKAAGFAWQMAAIYGKDSGEPTLALCQEGLDQLKKTGKI